MISASCSWAIPVGALRVHVDPFIDQGRMRKTHLQLISPQFLPHAALAAADSDLRLRILEHGIEVMSALSITLCEIHKNAYFRIFGPYRHSVLCPIVLPSFHNISIGQPLLCGILAGHIYLSSFFLLY